jgi:hypothetical protein
VTRRLLLVLLAASASLLPPPARATTAASLADRIVIDGRVSDWAADEWVLDSTTSLPEPDGDSRWGAYEELLRVGVTWDARFLYVAVEFRASSSALFAGLRCESGGLASLDGAGLFRRAIDLPFASNVLLLADPRGAPLVARVDGSGPLVGVDRAAAPAVTRAPLGENAVFEAALPWSLLSLALPLEIVTALTGGEGTGAGDAAPDPSVALPATATPASKARASLDRWLSVPADADQDGVPDAGISPRTVATVGADADAPSPRSGAPVVDARMTPRVFAPDNGESADLAVTVSDAADVETLYVTARVYAMDGTEVRVLYQDAARTVAGAGLEADPRDRWDGRDSGGAIVAGGVYVVSVEWGRVAGEKAGRATAGVAVAR